MRLNVANAAAVSVLWGTPAPEGRPVAASEIEHVFRHNGVPIAALDSDVVSRVQERAGLADYIKRDQTILRRLEERYAAIVERWSQDGVRSVLLKSPGYFPYTSSNLDVLVDPAMVDVAARSLRSFGYIESHSLREPYKRYFKDPASDVERDDVHLHTAVAWITRFITAEAIMQNARQSRERPNFDIPSVEHLVMITLAHFLYEDKTISLRDLLNMSLATHDSPDWQAIAAETHRGGWRKGFDIAVSSIKRVGRALGIGDLESLPETDADPRFVTRIESAAAFPIESASCQQDMEG
ncbi:MAG: nucleotidyltransferase family protein [Actinomycetota bacterium]|nr:nucleotidyltransferase family protein [Actinomycetota bacterium]